MTSEDETNLFTLIARTDELRQISEGMRAAHEQMTAALADLEAGDEQAQARFDAAAKRFGEFELLAQAAGQKHQDS